MSDWSTHNWEEVDLSGLSEAFTIGRTTPSDDNGPRSAELVNLAEVRRSKPKTVQHMLILTEKGIERNINLNASTYSLGRHPANSIVLHDEMVSRQHALLLRIPKSKRGDCLFRITDGNLQGKRSQNGILVNGRRCYSHDLRDYDVITFSDNSQAIYRQIKNPSSPSQIHLKQLSESTLFDVQEQERFSDAALVRLSSFPEMTPHPIIEIGSGNEITYLNPAAEQQFPNIRDQPQHPILEGLGTISYAKTFDSNLREVTVGDRIYEQYIHCIPQSQLVRCYLIEITQRCQMQEAVRKSEERYALAARGANDGLWDWNIVDNTIYLSPRWEAMIGAEEHELTDSIDEWFDRVHPDDIKRVKNELQQNIKGNKPFFECEFRLLHHNGDYRYFRSRGMVVFNEANQAIRMAGSQTDITEFNLAREQLLRDAFYDLMTSLPNRVLLLDRMGQALKQCKRYEDQYCAVLFLDLDRFKVINDSLGHIIGDKLLVEVAQRLKTSMRDQDTIARLGSDEFVVLLTQLESPDDAIATAKRIQATLKQPYNIASHEIFSTVSIGIAIGNRHYEDPETLLRDADVAMYQAKSEGKEKYAIFKNAMHLEAVALLNLENDLRRAIENNEFQLFYQPIIDLQTSQISSFEALIRWFHPTQGLIPPSDFIPLAEDTGMIIPMGDWLIREACQQARQWQQDYPLEKPLSVCINISSLQFAHSGFISTIEAILSEIPLPAGSIKLEITEGVIMKQPELVAEKLIRLKEMGVKLSVDDFGTGYSSLSYLQSFPVDTLKVDRSFVMKMGHSESREIVKTIVMLAHNLGLDVVAEGVETDVQAQLLKSMNCEYVQGYFYSHPVDQKATHQLLAEMFASKEHEQAV